VRDVLKFAQTGSVSLAIVCGSTEWAETMFARFIPPGQSVAVMHNLLELMMDSPENFFPTAEERLALRWFAGDRAKLGPSNRYFLAVQNEELRLRAEAGCGNTDFLQLIQLYQATQSASKLVSEMQSVLQAASNITASPELADVLLLVREWGNVLNLTSVFSYEVSALRSLREVRGGLQGLTLLHFLAAVFKKRDRERAKKLLALQTDTNVLSEALQKLELDTLFKLNDMPGGLPSPLLSEGRQIKAQLSQAKESLIAAAQVLCGYRYRPGNNQEWIRSLFTACCDIGAFLADFGQALRSLSDDIENTVPADAYTGEAFVLEPTPLVQQPPAAQKGPVMRFFKSLVGGSGVPSSAEEETAAGGGRIPPPPPPPPPPSRLQAPSDAPSGPTLRTQVQNGQARHIVKWSTRSVPDKHAIWGRRFPSADLRIRPDVLESLFVGHARVDVAPKKTAETIRGHLAWSKPMHLLGLELSMCALGRLARGGRGGTCLPTPEEATNALREALACVHNRQDSDLVRHFTGCWEKWTRPAYPHIAVLDLETHARCVLAQGDAAFAKGLFGTAISILPEGDGLRRSYENQVARLHVEARTDAFLRLLTVVYSDEWLTSMRQIRVLSCMNEVINGTRAVTGVYERVLKSKGLRYILRLALAVGNFLNHHRGRPVRGFAIESVLKIGDVKASDGRTLMHVLVHAMARDFPDGLAELLALAKDLPFAARTEDRRRFEYIHGERTIHDGCDDFKHNITNFTEEWVEFRVLGKMPSGIAEEYATVQGLLEKEASMRQAARSLFASSVSSHSSKSVLHSLNNFLSALEQASFDLRWFQLTHPQGAPQPHDLKLAREVRRDVWGRVCETALVRRIRDKDFTAAVALVYSSFYAPYATLPRGGVPALQAVQQREDDEGGSPAAAGPVREAEGAPEDEETIGVRLLVVGGGQIDGYKARLSSTTDALITFARTAVGRETAACFFSGREVPSGLTLRQCGLHEGCSVLVHSNSAGHHQPDQDQPDAQNVPQGVRGIIALRDPADQPLSDTGLLVAMAIDGSAGGGHEEAVFYRDFGGMAKMQDGRYYFLAPGSAATAAAGADGENQDARHLWEFALAGYAPPGAAVPPNQQGA
jgi:hypothetical protein